jgi:hypothetical protein
MQPTQDTDFAKKRDEKRFSTKCKGKKETLLGRPVGHAVILVGFSLAQRQKRR